MKNVYETDRCACEQSKTIFNQILSGYSIVLMLANSFTIARRWLKHGYKKMSKVQSPELKLMIPVNDEY